MSDQLSDVDLISYVEDAKADAIHAFNVLGKNGTLSASLTFHVTHHISGHDKLLHIRFPGGLARDQSPTIAITKFSDQKDHILHEARLDADTVIHAHTNFLSAWSLAHKPFPILYVAAARHLAAREIPNHLDRTRSGGHLPRLVVAVPHAQVCPSSRQPSRAGASFSYLNSE